MSTVMSLPSLDNISPSTAVRLALEAAIVREHLMTLKAVPAWQADAEDSLSGQLQDILRSVAEHVLEEMIENGQVPGDDLARKMLLRYIDDASGQFAETLDAASQSAAQHGRDQVVSEIRRSAAGLQAGAPQVSFNQFPEQTRDLIRNTAFEASERTIQRITGDVVANLTQSYEDGVGIDEAARRLRDAFDGMTDSELRRVARTEIVSAQNQGTYLTRQELGVDYHEWLSADDDRTRESHQEMNGQIVRVGDRFSNGLLFPGDFGSGVDLSELINCRCRTASFLMPEGKMAPSGSEYFYESDLIDIVQEAA